MKKKIIIPIVICLFIVICIVGFIVWNNKTVSTITLDINPSIEINLNRNEKVNSIVALNEDAKEIVDGIEGKSLEDAFEIIATNLVEKNYAYSGNNLDVILHVEGKFTSDDISKKIEYEFGKKDIHTEVIIVEEITEEDEELAKKYNVSPAKASYINSIAKENDNISLDDLANKPVNELKETKETGNYCDEGYTLENDKCFKEKERIDAINGSVCPNGYTDFNGKCYRETRIIENNQLSCREGFKLVDNDCVRTDTHKAEKRCNNGELRGDKCLERTIIGEAYEFCRDSGRTLYDHKCLATKPTINGGCLNGDMLLNGKCVNTRNDYYMAEWKCPDGRVKSNADGSLQDNDTHCYGEKFTSDYSYSCEDESYTLVGDDCTITYKEPPERELTCQNGSIKTENGRCIDQNDSKEKIDGFYCEGINDRLEGNKCIIYDVVEAKHN